MKLKIWLLMKLLTTEIKNLIIDEITDNGNLNSN